MTSEERYDKDELNLMVDEIVFSRQDWSVWEWTEKSGLSSSTCYNLLHRITQRPQFRTVDRMAYAAFGVGLVELVRKGLGTRLRKVG